MALKGLSESVLLLRLWFSLLADSFSDTLVSLLFLKDVKHIISLSPFSCWPFLRSLFFAVILISSCEFSYHQVFELTLTFPVRSKPSHSVLQLNLLFPVCLTLLHFSFFFPQYLSHFMILYYLLISMHMVYCWLSTTSFYIVIIKRIGMFLFFTIVQFHSTMGCR